MVVVLAIDVHVLALAGLGGRDWTGADQNFWFETVGLEGEDSLAQGAVRAFLAAIRDEHSLGYREEETLHGGEALGPFLE